MDKKVIAVSAAVISAAVLLFGSMLVKNNIRLKKELDNRAGYEELCERFIVNYVKNVNALRDYILRDEQVDSLILRIDKSAFEFAGQSDLVEYNIYALDRNQYWDQFREE